MEDAQPWIHPAKWGAQTSQGIWDTNGSHDFSQTTRPFDSHQKRKKKKEKEKKKEGRQKKENLLNSELLCSG